MARNSASISHVVSRVVSAAALAALLLPLSPNAAAASNGIGVAAAVNPDALSHLGGVTRQISIGKNILYNERIATSKKGLVQVLFLDGSTITVGPGSDLVIDKFIYDPNKGTGELTASFSKGMLRFVGGKLSKRAGAVKFETPVGTLGIRGGMFQGDVGDGQGNFSFLFGEEMTFTGNNGQTSNVFQPNNTLQVGGSGPTIRPTTPQDAQFFIEALSGSGGGGTGPTDEQFQSSGIGGANSGDNQGSGLEQLFNLFNGNNNNENENEDSTSDVIRQLVQNQNQNNNTNNPPPDPIDNGIDNTPDVAPGPLPEPRPGFDQLAGFTAGFVGTISASDENSDINLKPIVSKTPNDFVLEIRKGQFGTGNRSLANLEWGGQIPRRTFVDVSVYDPPFGDITEQYDVSFSGLSKDGDILAFSFESFFDRLLKQPSEAVDLPLQGISDQPSNYTRHIGVLAGTNGLPLCEACDFLKWGAWATADVDYANHEPTQADIRAALWIAGDVTANADLPVTGSATYAGVAGGIASNKIGGQWQTPHSATGDMNMSWDFGKRSGRLDITNFDNGQYNFGGKMKAPHPVNQFWGGVAGSGLEGSATGAIVKNGSDNAGGVIGNFNVEKPDYSATGVFGGAKVPD